MERKFDVTNRKTVARVRSGGRRPGCIRLFVCPSTGGRLEISVSPRETILGLKAALARKLRLPPSRISLIYKDKALHSGCLLDHQIPDQSHITLLPNLEAGLSLHQSEKSIMQALENLTETQVNDFLSGRSPLMLAIRMGEHMVFVQLQLSTLNGQVQGQRPVSPATAALLSPTGLSASALAEATRCLSQRLHQLHQMNGVPPGTKPTSAPTPTPSTSIPAPFTSTPAPSTSTLAPTSTPATPTPSTSKSTSSPKSSSASECPRPHPRQLARPTATPPSTPSRGTPSVPSMLPLAPNTSSSLASLPSPPPSPGAVIEHMKHVGRGVYTGTFSGTLDRSLQDGNGQPRRSVHTILHILNDLLVAAPATASTGVAQVSTPRSKPHLQSSQAPPSVTVNGMLTPPSSPVRTSNPGFGEESSENALLRGKMQHIQKMLAQRKQQRKTRRELSAPYSCPQTSRSVSAGAHSSSSSPSPSASSSSSVKSVESSVLPCGHLEGSPDCCSAYGQPSLEQDSLAV